MRRTLRSLAILLLFSLHSGAEAATCDQSWPAWESFKKTMINDAGRVVDDSADDMRTTSEGQAYALFFALVANDKPAFEKLLNWTEKNLAEGDLTTRLPAWLWGKKDDNSTGILDDNSASDADLWMAYSIGEAGRLWADRRYVALSSLMADRILAAETAEIGKLGIVLLPGAIGFHPSPAVVRLNPSYTPMQLMRWFAARSQDPRWTALAKSSLQIIVNASPQGFAPDWTIYDDEKGFLPEAAGSYDAIRVYLWAGMLNRDDPARRLLIDTFKPMARYITSHRAPPESIQIATGIATRPGSNGFSAATLPFLQASGLPAGESHPVEPATDNYYDQVLNLFATGWLKDMYHFDLKGNLTTRRMSKCQ